MKQIPDPNVIIQNVYMKDYMARIISNQKINLHQPTSD